MWNGNMDDTDDLLSMFVSLGTTDHSTLVEQFNQIVPGAPEGAAEFFLEANSWSLQNAIVSYFDQGHMAQARHMPLAELVCDVTFGDGEEITPSTAFRKTWRLRNSGSIPWPVSSRLVPVQGEHMGAPDYVSLPPLQPGQSMDISVDLVSPPEEGNYYQTWRFSCENPVTMYFGEEIFVVITVGGSGMLGLLQQMSGTTM
eukprot:m.23815 g.23815  ORF g.23815 m.23815 type:complete len:200 (-) comp8533_c0_seq2:494-1093(-)